MRVIVRDRSELTDKFVDYDTRYLEYDCNGMWSEQKVNHFPLPPNKYMILVFIGNEFIPFTTVRRFTEEKYSYYKSEVGNVFNINLKQKEDTMY